MKLGGVAYLAVGDTWGSTKVFDCLTSLPWTWTLTTSPVAPEREREMVYLARVWCFVPEVPAVLVGRM